MRSCAALINTTTTTAVTISTWHWARHCGRYLDIPPTAIHDVLLLDPILILISWLEALAAIPHATHLKSTTIGTVLHFSVIIVLVLVLLGLQNSLLIAAAVVVAIIIIIKGMLLLILMMTVLFHPIHLLLLVVAIVEIPLRWCRGRGVIAIDIIAMAVVVVVSILHYYPRMGVQIRTQRHHILQRIPWMVVMVMALLLLVMHMMAICVGFLVGVNNATT